MAAARAFPPRAFRSATALADRERAGPGDTAGAGPPRHGPRDGARRAGVGPSRGAEGGGGRPAARVGEGSRRRGAGLRAASPAGLRARPSRAPGAFLVITWNQR